MLKLALNFLHINSISVNQTNLINRKAQINICKIEITAKTILRKSYYQLVILNKQYGYLFTRKQFVEIFQMCISWPIAVLL